MECVSVTEEHVRLMSSISCVVRDARRNRKRVGRQTDYMHGVGQTVVSIKIAAIFWT